MLELSRDRPEQWIHSQILGPLATNKPCLSNPSISKAQRLIKEMWFLLSEWRSIIAKYFPGTVQPSQGEKRYQDMSDLAFSGKLTFAASSPSCFHLAERQPLALPVSSKPCFGGGGFFSLKRNNLDEVILKLCRTLLLLFYRSSTYMAVTQWKL